MSWALSAASSAEQPQVRGSGLGEGLRRRMASNSDSEEEEEEEEEEEVTPSSMQKATSHLRGEPFILERVAFFWGEGLA